MASSAFSVHNNGSHLVTAGSVPWSLCPLVEFTDVNYPTEAALPLSCCVFFDDCEAANTLNILVAFNAHLDSITIWTF